MASTSLDQTLRELDRVLEFARAGSSPLGIFPAMYRSVTAAVREAVRSGGFFDDDSLVEHLTVVFADLYLDALDSHRNGGSAPACWSVAFDAAGARRRRMILQHLLLGMNAHINLDLGVATVLAGERRLASLWADFVRVNEILFQVLDRLQNGLGSVSPRSSMIDRLGGPLDEGFMRLGIRTARDLAFHFAEHLAEASDRATGIAARDRDVARLGHSIIRPWSPIDLVGRIIARNETTDMGAVVAALSGQDVDLGRAERDAQGCIARGPAPDRPLVRPHHLRR